MSSDEATITDFWPWAVELDERGYLRSKLPFSEATQGASFLPTDENGFVVDLSMVKAGDSLLLVREDPRTGMKSAEEIKVSAVSGRRLSGHMRVYAIRSARK